MVQCATWQIGIRSAGVELFRASHQKCARFKVFCIEWVFVTTRSGGPGVAPTTESSTQLPSPPPLRTVANMCASGACPTIFENGPETLLVQGFVVSPEHAGLSIPEGEMLVQIPKELLMEALRNLS